MQIMRQIINVNLWILPCMTRLEGVGRVFSNTIMAPVARLWMGFFLLLSATSSSAFFTAHSRPPVAHWGGSLLQRRSAEVAVADSVSEAAGAVASVQAPSPNGRTVEEFLELLRLILV